MAGQAATARPDRPALGQVGPPWWDERPVFVVCGGPSLKGRDLSGLRERGWVLGVNRAADFCPVDATVCIDSLWIGERAAALEAWARDPGHQVYLAITESFAQPPIPGATYLRRLDPKARGQALSTDLGALANGLNSGYAALNLAVLKRARQIYMLGLDLVPVTPQEPVHWHAGYPADRGRGAMGQWADWARRFDAAARGLPPGVEVWNANPASAVRCFPFVTYESLGL